MSPVILSESFYSFPISSKPWHGTDGQTGCNTRPDTRVYFKIYYRSLDRPLDGLDIAIKWRCRRGSRCNHRLRGSASPVLTATHHSYGSPRLSDFFSGSRLEFRPSNRFWRKMAQTTWIHARMILLQ